MNSDKAHELACRALGADDRIRRLDELHGDELYLSLMSPSIETKGQWVELALLGMNPGYYLDDPAARSVVVGRCLVDPVNGECQVIVESGSEPEAISDQR